jgi:hypothetical protein
MVVLIGIGMRKRSNVGPFNHANSFSQEKFAIGKIGIEKIACMSTLEVRRGENDEFQAHTPNQGLPGSE